MNVGGKHGKLAKLHRVNQKILFSEDNIDKIYEMEIEGMEDLVLIIDEGDEGNPLVVFEYIQDISIFYYEIKVLSYVPLESMSTKTDINHIMRAFVVD